MDENLTDHYFGEISERLKRVTWLIKVTGSYDGLVTYGSGFAIKVGDSDSTVLMTCSHVIQDNCKIRVRRVHDNGFPFEAEVISFEPTWDLSLLRVKGANNNDLCADFAENGSISMGETLLHVGHSTDYVWSFFVGRAVYQCVDVPEGADHTCEEHMPSSFNNTPAYRTMGDVWNKLYFDDSPSKKNMFKFEKNLSANMQIIQCAGLCCRGGCSGGPVFNCKGRVVGLIMGGSDGFQVAVHVSQLTRFARMYSSKDARPLKRKGPDESSSSIM